MLKKETKVKLYYDSECGLCQWFVRFVKKRDTKRLVELIVIQGTSYEAEQMDDCGCIYSMVVIDAETSYLYDQAALEVWRRLRFPWPLISVLSLLVPSFIRKAIYSFVAKHRLRLFKNPST